MQHNWDTTNVNNFSFLFNQSIQQREFQQYHHQQQQQNHNINNHPIASPSNANMAFNYNINARNFMTNNNNDDSNNNLFKFGVRNIQNNKNIINHSDSATMSKPSLAKKPEHDKLKPPGSNKSKNGVNGNKNESISSSDDESGASGNENDDYEDDDDLDDHVYDDKACFSRQSSIKQEKQIPNDNESQYKLNFRKLMPNKTRIDSYQTEETKNYQPASNGSDSMQKKQAEASGSKGELLCVVCGASANGYNFDAITCESCKAFFRRNAFRNPNLFRCSNNNNCVITIVSRKKCKKCRIKKCFDLGMRKDWIMTEGEREEKRRKIEENRRKKATFNGNTSDNNDNTSQFGNESGMYGYGDDAAGYSNDQLITDDNNNSYGEQKLKPIRRRRRRRRHSQIETKPNQQQQPVSPAKYQATTSSTPTPLFNSEHMQSQLDCLNQMGKQISSSFMQQSASTLQAATLAAAAVASALTSKPQPSPSNQPQNPFLTQASMRLPSPIVANNFNPIVNLMNQQAHFGANSAATNFYDTYRNQIMAKANTPLDSASGLVGPTSPHNLLSSSSNGVIKPISFSDLGAVNQNISDKIGSYPAESNRNDLIVRRRRRRRRNKADFLDPKTNSEIENSYYKSGAESSASIPYQKFSAYIAHNKSLSDPTQPTCSAQASASDKQVYDESLTQLNSKTPVVMLSPDSNARQTPSVSPSISLGSESSPNIPLMSDLQRQQVDAIKEAYHQAIQLVKAQGLPKNSGDINTTINITELGVRRIIFYFKLISDFRELPHDIMVKLLKQSMMSLLQIHGINSYNKEENSFKQPYTDDVPFSAESLESVYGEEVYKITMDITRNMYDLCNRDMTYIKILMLIVLFDPLNENLTLREKRIVSELQNKYVTLIYAYMCESFGTSTAELTFKGMIFELNKVNELSRWFEKAVVEKSNYEYVRPLMKEVFSFPTDSTPPMSSASFYTSSSSSSNPSSYPSSISITSSNLDSSKNDFRNRDIKSIQSEFDTDKNNNSHAVNDSMSKTNNNQTNSINS